MVSTDTKLQSSPEPAMRFRNERDHDAVASTLALRAMTHAPGQKWSGTQPRQAPCKQRKDATSEVLAEPRNSTFPLPRGELARRAPSYVTADS